MSIVHASQGLYKETPIPKRKGGETNGFVSGSSRATSQWVTYPRIALAPNSLNFRVPTTSKPVSSQKASC
ncbi:hypothetical protein L3X38_009291 [Prunus dulcis]|uniref:Uncharacterized protein n=1 Tax=Prunus dulcis TaxID=3755 RepID=A0AAD4ZYB8_PRUDU|nr:hypothetical protein L3X38_009291 [Prunus dulcis]